MVCSEMGSGKNFHSAFIQVWYLVKSSANTLTTSSPGVSGAEEEKNWRLAVLAIRAADASTESMILT
ncbi:hypothetical protein ES703_111281 [subsurface metagenome]